MSLEKQRLCESLLSDAFGSVVATVARTLTTGRKTLPQMCALSLPLPRDLVRSILQTNLLFCDF
jgi:hypothetical protein